VGSATSRRRCLRRAGDLRRCSTYGDLSGHIDASHDRDRSNHLRWSLSWESADSWTAAWRSWSPNRGAPLPESRCRVRTCGRPRWMLPVAPLEPAMPRATGPLHRHRQFRPLLHGEGVGRALAARFLPIRDGKGRRQRPCRSSLRWRIPARYHREPLKVGNIGVGPDPIRPGIELGKDVGWSRVRC
jgi:hypothetical protein